MNKEYMRMIVDLKQSIIQSRYAAARLANKEQLLLYFKTGKVLSEKIAAERWGVKIVEQIADDLQKQLPGLRGFSYRNLMKMKQFAETYAVVPFLPSVTAEIRKIRNRNVKMETAEYNVHFFSISFSHHIVVLNKCKSLEEKMFYISQAASQCWSVSILEHYIDSNLFFQQGKLPNNFDKTLPEKLKSSALMVFQDEYLIDFMTPGEIEDERVLEEKVVSDIKHFIMKMGQGFSFIGNQYRLELAGEEFFIDLLFFNRHLHCLVAFELKRGKFKPEYAGQLNFYLNVLDEKVKLTEENPSIGIILCKEKNNTVVEFAVKTIDKAMGVATYRTSKEVPKEMKGIMPDPGELVKLL
ncbi:PDDEXK nuclease domain-containing protein [Flavitalea sp. BT771]|uniref:PDDEXK nuclease domain-containing protein n=1 Tax=Flavitalea sp. BT771 TaxID=3063329 RepID=UPI0026E35040|nr:PDDEXK nuclease domain-containing protein [Flavitalea sp. BT771]MDO6430625.1 PDDEXK nuclease domain-containing protein [Flavitalea sp. BT771]MDV6219235.1 PDDEXK nuclease domain-containing protein [Flavitalea sp. BT771]